MKATIRGNHSRWWWYFSITMKMQQRPRAIQPIIPFLSCPLHSPDYKYGYKYEIFALDKIYRSFNKVKQYS